MSVIRPRLRSRRSRVIPAGVVLAAAAGFALAPVLPAGATTHPAGMHRSGSTSTAAMSHPERDFAGSTIPAHEPVARGGGGGIHRAASGLPGLDVSGYQGNVDWGTVAADGAAFAYVKATENTDYTNPYFSQQYDGAYAAGLIRGAYHFATPDRSSGTAQADYFVDNGGGWSPDGKTLPPMLDIEYNPYGATCYGLSQDSMVGWISDFVNEVHARTNKWATIYSTFDWWSTCTGNSAAFAANDPLFIASYSSSVGTLPAGWGYYTFWQYADSGTFPGDQDVFNGTEQNLINLATLT
ncbi:MAG: lysozyme [Mycobacteriales bacterium]|nr:MAG: hypothetical protein DLM56_08400 [Pseudonocardiales bacterium]